MITALFTSLTTPQVFSSLTDGKGLISKKVPPARFTEHKVHGAHFKPKPTTGDGNCFFYQLINQLNLEESAMELRCRASKYYEDNHEKLFALFKNFTISWQAAANGVKRNYANATPVKLVVLSLMLEINVI